MNEIPVHEFQFIASFAEIAQFSRRVLMVAADDKTLCVSPNHPSGMYKLTGKPVSKDNRGNALYSSQDITAINWHSKSNDAVAAERLPNGLWNLNFCGRIDIRLTSTYYFMLVEIIPCINPEHSIHAHLLRAALDASKKQETRARYRKQWTDVLVSGLSNEDALAQLPECVQARLSTMEGTFFTSGRNLYRQRLGQEFEGAEASRQDIRQSA